MDLFYREMWVGKATPAEAMRRAQLAVYRDPGSVKEWARGRSSSQNRATERRLDREASSQMNGMILPCDPHAEMPNIT